MIIKAIFLFIVLIKNRKEYIDLKCLKCDYEERVEAGIVLECFNPRFSDYPISYCPNCYKPKQVSLDVYNQIKVESNKK